jgi:hypothetical protein
MHEVPKTLHPSINSSYGGSMPQGSCSSDTEVHGSMICCGTTWTMGNLKYSVNNNSAQKSFHEKEIIDKESNLDDRTYGSKYFSCSQVRLLSTSEILVLFLLNWNHAITRIGYLNDILNTVITYLSIVIIMLSSSCKITERKILALLSSPHTENTTNHWAATSKPAPRHPWHGGWALSWIHFVLNRRHLQNRKDLVSPSQE